MTGDPHNDPNAQGDAFKTLFVARVVSMLKQMNLCFEMCSVDKVNVIEYFWFMSNVILFLL